MKNTIKVMYVISGNSTKDTWCEQALYWEKRLVAQVYSSLFITTPVLHQRYKYQM